MADSTGLLFWAENLGNIAAVFITKYPINHSYHMRWVYLSKQGQDEYINRLAQSAGVLPTPIERWQYEDDTGSGLVLRGIMKHKIMKRCWQDGRQFRYMDTGYFGNRPSALNPHGWKWYHRIVPNDLQHGDIIDRPSDRWQKLAIKIQPWRRTGRSIVVVVPDEKACTFYDTAVDSWLEHTIEQIKQHTDRPVIIRHRTADPDARTRDRSTSFASVLAGDVHAVVTFNSVAATESILAGIPAFVNAPANAARPVANTDFSRLDDPWYADSDFVQAWACHLAYGQFHIDELSNGTALRILDEYSL